MCFTVAVIAAVLGLVYDIGGITDNNAASIWRHMVSFEHGTRSLIYYEYGIQMHLEKFIT